MAELKIWITVPTFNRQKIAEIVIRQLSNHKKEHFLHVSDDYSTAYDPFKLFDYADKVEKPPKKMGVQHLRCWEFREFLKTDYDLIYMTDSDALHDPNFINRLLELYDRTKLPVCLYNTKWHQTSTIVEDKNHDFYYRRTMPGISQMYNREMVKKIVTRLNRTGDPVYAWDYRVVEYLKTQVVTSKTSYVQHFGGPGSIHNKTLQQDIALTPTNYLKAMWNPTLQKIK